MKALLTPTLTAALLAVACSTPAPENTDTPAAEVVPVAVPAVIAPSDARLQLVPAPAATQFPGASLALEGTSTDPAAGKTSFTYKVDGYELKAQTPDAPERGCANSADGQHIHFILNNAPYLAKYEPTFSEKLGPGRNIVLAFLSRSYHESLKDGAAVVVSEVAGPGEGGVQGGDLATDPFLFYSRPKGDYKRTDGQKVLLDFYLLNTTLADKGHRVRATIDGQAWTITKWDAYFIEGLQPGAHTVRLELIDAAGNPVPGPFNDSGERTFNFLEG